MNRHKELAWQIVEAAFVGFDTEAKQCAVRRILPILERAYGLFTIGDFQNEIRRRLIEHYKLDNALIDGSGSDSDEIDLTWAEIQQAIAQIEEKRAYPQGEQRFVEKWQHGCAAVCANLELWVARCPQCGMPHVEGQTLVQEGTWAWALEQMKAGKRVINPSKSESIGIDPNGFVDAPTELEDYDDNFLFEVRDFERCDWAVVEE